MEYRRCQGKSYMILEQQEAVSGYEFFMLRENRISGILPMQQMQNGDGVRYWYEISGRHDLEGYACFHKLGFKLLENFILSLYRTVCSLGEYLLLEDGISLDPAMIYMNYNDREISFCYIPGNKKKLTDSLKDFMEYFLKHMEHGEQQETEICYQVYEKCQMEHVCLLDLVELAAKNTAQEDGGVYPAESQDVWEESEPETVKQEKEQKTGKKGRFKGNFLLKKKFSLKFGSKKTKEGESRFVFEPEEFVEETSNPTVFLGSESKEVIGELRYEGDGRGKNFKIDVPSFLIGSQEDEVNGVIFTSSVSRHHAAIYKEDDKYYIEDLNSTNGTYLNGELLSYKEKVLLSKNDKVKFADEMYRFV